MHPQIHSAMRDRVNASEPPLHHLPVIRHCFPVCISSTWILISVISGLADILVGDDDPSVDNYVGGRRKRQFRGPWYDHQPIRDNNKKQRSFKRQYDSGVFLGSDGTDMDEGLEESESVYANLSLRQWSSSQNAVKQEPTPEDRVREHIELCLETGNETIE